MANPPDQDRYRIDADSDSSNTRTVRLDPDEQVAEIVADVLARRAKGEDIPDTQIIAAYPELMPALGEALENLRRIRHAQRMAATAGPNPDTIAAISASRIDEPLEVGPQAPVPEGQLPTITGYHLLHEINTGGQATVYKAVQQSTGRTVAVKVLFGGPFLNARGRSRFERESAVLATLNHPHIVRIVDRGRSADGSFYLVMDYIDGLPLDEALERRNWRLEDVLRLFIKVADAVQEAHSQGIVHRDLKPSNVRVDARGEPHVLDFGPARLLADVDELDLRRTVTVTGNVIGSLPWSSPEQASGAVRKIDARSDVYSLGVMLYEALTGQHPYPVSGSTQQTLVNIQTVEPTPFSAIRDVRYPLDAKLEAIVFKALAKEPERRYPSAGAMAQDIEAYLTGRPTVACPRPVPRPWRRYAAAVLGALALLGAAGYALYRTTPTPPQQLAVKLPTYRNSIGMEFVQIPAGTFRMGSPLNESGRGTDEQPHTVRLTRAYYISVTEVAVAHYRQVMGTVPGQPARDDLPVVGVTWHEAVEFCRRLSAREGRIYRLPTEAEWEYACRAGTTGRYAGTGYLDDMGWYQGNAAGQLQPVASKLPNQWGLYDMHGNAAEWCSDGYWDTLGPMEVTDPVGPDSSEHRVIRGGSVNHAPERCRSAARHCLFPVVARDDIGFRVVLEVDSSDPGK